jgi:hypothetical protein
MGPRVRRLSTDCRYCSTARDGCVLSRRLVVARVILLRAERQRVARLHRDVLMVGDVHQPVLRWARCVVCQVGLERASKLQVSVPCSHPCAEESIPVLSSCTIAGLVHFINAWQFWWSWYGRRWNESRDPRNPATPRCRPVMQVVVWPEYMNIVGSCLYLVSASYYQQVRERRC